MATKDAAKNVCCICGKVDKTVVECKSTLNAKMLYYCQECLRAGYELYEDLLTFGWEFNAFSNTYRQKILLPTLTLKNKSIEQFNEEVKKKLEENDET